MASPNQEDATSSRPLDKRAYISVEALIAHRGAGLLQHLVQAAATVLGLIPVLILFLGFQKTFIAGMTSGAVKA